jgi:hypothetical protein
MQTHINKNMAKKGQIALIGFILMFVAIFIFLVVINPILNTFADAGIESTTDPTSKLLMGSGGIIFLLLIIGLSLKAIRQGYILE